MSDEESFVILGSSPTPSMELYSNNTSMMTKDNGLQNDVQNGSSISENMMQSSTQTINNFSLLNKSFKSLSLSANSANGSSNYDSLNNSVVIKNKNVELTNQGSTADFAEQFLMGEIPVDSLKYSIWKQFPSLCTSQSTDEDIGKLENLLSERVKLKENLQKTNEAMHQHLSTINEWQKRFKESQEQQASKVAECNEANALLSEELRLKIVENENLHTALTERDEFNQKLKNEIMKLKEEHEEKNQQFKINIGYAVGENNELTQELSAKNAIIQNMTTLIDRLEKQSASFEFVSMQRNDARNSIDIRDQNSSLELSQFKTDLTTCTVQLNAAREQNIQLMEDVTNKISTIKRLENQSSKLKHQLLSLEMIVNENNQTSCEDNEVARKLNDEINQVSIENTDLRKMKNQHIEEMDQLKEQLASEKEHSINDARQIQSLRSLIDTQIQQLKEFNAKNDEQQSHITDLQKENVLLRSKEINADIQMRQKDQQLAEINEENLFLKAQLDVYKSDFEMERQSRQDIANEREELLSDLKLLQRRNQQLMDESQSRTNATSSTTLPQPQSSSSEHVPRSIPKFVCPICNKASPNLLDLQSHVQICLEK